MNHCILLLLLSIWLTGCGRSKAVEPSARSSQQPALITSKPEGPWDNIAPPPKEKFRLFRIKYRKACLVDNIGEVFCSGYPGVGPPYFGWYAETSPEQFSRDDCLRAEKKLGKNFSTTTNFECKLEVEDDFHPPNCHCVLDTLKNSEKVLFNIGPIKQLTLGINRICGVSESKQLECVYYRTQFSVVRKIFPWKNVVDVSLSWHGGCALLSDGQVACWKRKPESLWPKDVAKSLVDPNYFVLPELEEHPHLLTLSAPAVQITESCLLNTQGRVICWEPELIPGKQFSGVSAENPQANMELISSLSDIKQVRSREKTACAITHKGKVYCWGNGYAKQTRKVVDKSAFQPVNVPFSHPVARIELGGDHFCALTIQNEVYCWGENLRHQIGPARKSCFYPTIHEPSGGGLPGFEKTMLKCYSESSCVYCPTPAPMTFPIDRIKDLALGYSVTCVLSHDSQIICSGSWNNRSAIHFDSPKPDYFLWQRAASPNYRLVR
jgi:hypothetical protein